MAVSREISYTGWDPKQEFRRDALGVGRDGCQRKWTSGWDKPVLPRRLVSPRKARRDV